MKRHFLAFSLFVCFLTLAFALTSFAVSLGDPFDGNSLQNPNWQWQNEPDEWDVGVTKAGWLHFVPKVNQNLWASDTTTRLYQEFDGDFDVETHIVLEYQGGCVVCGIVALSPVEDNWTTLKFWGRAGDAIIQWQHKQSEVVGNVPDSSQPAGTVEAFFRMAKQGNNYLGWWKKAEGDDWIEIKPDAPMDLTPPIQVGIFGGICADTGEATVEYEYFKDLVEPITSVKPDTKLSTTWGQIKSCCY
jgi:hypothetical protein